MKHTKSSAFVFVSVIAFFAAIGCTSKQTKENLSEKVTAESHVTTPAALNAEVKDAIRNSTDLSPDQKAQLTSLKNETHAKLEDYRQQSLKLQSVLVKDIVAPKYDISEVNLIKSKLKKLENERLNLIFDSVDKANLIMGRQALQNQEVLHNMYDGDGIR